MKLSIILTYLPAISLAFPVYEAGEQLGPLISIVSKGGPKLIKEAPKIVKGVEKVAPKVVKQAPKVVKGLSADMKKALSKLNPRYVPYRR
jgi:hypothetical protein